MFGLIKVAEEVKKGKNTALINKVYDYLKENYPEDVLEWVKDASWELVEAVPLDEVKMARRPGGAREMDKVKGIAQAVKDGKPMDPVVLVKLSDDSYKIADGYHRTLGFKHAEKDSIKAYVAQTDSDSGPWDKEMHEKKLNVGKKANEMEYGLAKVALNAVELGKRYVGGLTGATKRKAQTELDHATELKDLHHEHMMNADDMKFDILEKTKDPIELEKAMNNHRMFQTRKSIEVNGRFGDAQQARRQAGRDQLVARGATGLAGTGALGAYNYNKTQQEAQMMNNQPQLAMMAGNYNQQPMMPKVAAQQEQEQGLNANQHAALGLAGLGAGAMTANKSVPLIDGMERLYHGTGEENAAKIREQGILGSLAGSGVPSQRVDLESQIGAENVANKSYATRSRMTAQGYAAQSGMEGRGSEVLELKIPYQHLQNGTLKEVPNPELRGMEKNEWAKHMVDVGYQKAIEEGMMDQEMVDQYKNNPLIVAAQRPMLNAAYNSLDAPNTLVVEGDIPSQYIKGATDYHGGQNLAGFVDYVKNNPGRFTKGLGLAGLGAAGIGAGAYEINKARQMNQG